MKKTRKEALKLLSIVLFFSTCISEPRAADYTWTWDSFSIPGSFHDAANWSPSGVPGTTDTVRFSGFGQMDFESDVTIARIFGGGRVFTGSHVLTITDDSEFGGTLGGTAIFLGDQYIRGDLRFGGANLVLHGTTTWNPELHGGSVYIIFGSSSSPDIIDNYGTFIDAFALMGGAHMNYNFHQNHGFNNYGTYIKTGDTQTRVNVKFNNTGVVNVEKGVLILSQGGQSSGRFNAAKGTAIFFDYGMQFSNVEFSGEGGFSVSNATFHTDQNFRGLNVGIGGTIASNHLIEVDRYTHESMFLGTGMLHAIGSSKWIRGGVSDGGTLKFSGNLDLSSGPNPYTSSNIADKHIQGGSVIFAGDTTWTNHQNIRGRIFLGQYGNNSARFENTGRFVDALVADSGLIAAKPGDYAFYNHGSYLKSGSATTQIDADFFNDGSLTLRAGSLRFTSKIVNNGIIDGSGLIINHSTLENAGTISPGDGIGAITFAGSLALGDAGTLDIDVSSETDFDRIQVAGALHLGGTLIINLLDGYTPAIGESFAIINHSGIIDGSFAHLVVSGDFEGRAFSVITDTGSLNLLVISAPVPEPTTWALLASGLALVSIVSRRRAVLSEVC